MAATSVAPYLARRLCLTGSCDHTARLWEVETGREVRQFTGHSGSVNSVAFSPNGRFALTGSSDSTARLWDVDAGKELNVFRGHLSYVHSVTFSPDANYVITAGDDSTTRLWNVSTGKELCRLVSFGHGNWVVVDFEDRYDASNGGGVLKVALVGCEDDNSLPPPHERRYI